MKNKGGVSTERLTYKDEFGRWTADVHYGGTVEHLRDLPIDRLAAYEEMGLMPEEIKANLEMFVAYRHVCGGRSPEEIAALAQAQDAGPCGLCRHNPPSSCDGKPCTMCPAEGCIVEEPIVFADGQCPRCGGMTHNYGGAVMRCPDCGWAEQEGVPDAIDGMCCDCLHEREPFCGDYSENVACPDRREDGSCWTAEQEGQDTKSASPAAQDTTTL